MSPAELMRQALELKADERVLVAETLLESLNRPDPALDAVWADAAERRLAAWRRGDSIEIPAEEIFPED